MTASLGSCIRALMPLMSAMSFCPPSLPKPLSLIPSYGGIRFEHTHLGVGGTNIHPRVATKRLPVSINSFTTCVFIVLYMLLFPILYRLLTGALTSNLKLSWGHVLCDRQNYSRKKWVPDPDPGCHTKVCYSLSWESTRPSRKQVTSEEIVWKFPVENGRTHHFCATCGLPVLQYWNVLVMDKGERELYQAMLGTAGSRVMSSIAAVSYIIPVAGNFKQAFTVACHFWRAGIWE